MIRKLIQSDTNLILNFVYQREDENMFITGQFDRLDDPFAVNSFYGYFDNKKLLGLAVHFGNWNNLNINAQDEKIIRALTDHIVSESLIIEAIACFRRYGDIMVNQLEKYGIKTKAIEDKSIFKLTQEDFVDFSTGKEETAKESDREELFRLEKLVFENMDDPEITEGHLSRITPKNEFIIRKDGKIAAKANINGLSKHYFQIGGVGTSPEYRRQGLAKRVVGFILESLTQGKSGLLFTDNDNIPSIKVYTALGFKPFDRYMIAQSPAEV